MIFFMFFMGAETKQAQCYGIEVSEEMFRCEQDGQGLKQWNEANS